MLRLEVAGLQLRDGGTPPVVVLRELGHDDGLTLCVYPSRAEAHDLYHEGQGMVTPRALAHQLLDRALRAAGARPAAVHLTRSCESCLVASLLIERDGSWIDVEIETAQALALAQRLRLPLWADPELFSGAAAARWPRHARS